MDKQAPTQEQIKEFWEWCGFVNEITRSPSLSGFGGDDIYNWTRPDKVIHSKELPPIDLNNLFLYAVPKVYAYVLQSFNEGHKNHHATVVLEKADSKAMKTYSTTIPRREDPALALFWALWQVKEKPNGKDIRVQEG